MKSTPLEKRILQFGLTLAFLYQGYQIINGYLSNATTVGLNVVIALFFLSALGLSIRLTSVTWVAVGLHVMMLPVLVYFWIEFGMLAGTVPLILYVYLSLIISTLHGYLLFAVLGAYLSTFLVLSIGESLTDIPLVDPTKVSPMQLSIDFIAIALIITVYLIYIKDRLITYRARITHRHQQLQHLAARLQEQNESLRHKQEETQTINDNLENIVEERIKAIEEKNRELEEYAFINAHLLRGPICSMLGVINLMELEGSGDKVRLLKEKAMKIDRIIKRVNDMM